MATAAAFTSLKPPISAASLAVVESLGFTRMTPVQAATIPLFLTNKDVCVEACTGSGKTLAFLIPVFDILQRRDTALKKHQVGAIIVSPIRELARQTAQVAELFIRSHSVLNVALTKRALPLLSHVEQFRNNGGNVLIATPGRLDDFLTRIGSEADLRQLEVLVFDEADRLLDMGFSPTITSILNRLPRQRRTGLFSATQTQEVTELARAGMRNPVRVSVKVEDKVTKEARHIPTSLQNYYMICDLDEKLSQLVKFLLSHAEAKTIVYFLTCSCVNFFWKVLTKLPMLAGIKFFSLHGKVPPEKRTSIYNKFLATESRAVLVTTDVAGRGLDIPDVDWIVQYDPPQDPNAFVHRIGRTARMGRSGSALAFLTPAEESYIEFLARRNIPLTAMPKYADAPADVLDSVKSMVSTDRDLMDRGTLAFVSFVRGYKEHHCSYIFRFAALDLVKLARAFALLRLPKMPELRSRQNELAAFVPADVDVDTVPYTDPVREQQRQDKLRRMKDNNAAEKAKRSRKNEPFSKAKEQRRKRKERREKKERKRQWKDTHEDREAEWEELAREVRLMKKLREGKISQKEFDKLTGEEDHENAEDSDQNDASESPKNRKRKDVTSDDSEELDTDDSTARALKRQKFQ